MLTIMRAECLEVVPLPPTPPLSFLSDPHTFVRSMDNLHALIYRMNRSTIAPDR